MLGEGKEHDLEPHTLLSYRGGLYLVGRSHTYDKVIWLAVERIRSVKPTPGVIARAAARASRTRRTSAPTATPPTACFGVADGPEAEVELAIANAQTESYLRSRDASVAALRSRQRRRVRL